MSGDCYYCHGLVFPEERDDFLLETHGDHEVYLHRQCATGRNLIEPAGDGAETVVCPECGDVETYEVA